MNLHTYLRELRAFDVVLFSVGGTEILLSTLLKIVTARWVSTEGGCASTCRGERSRSPGAVTAGTPACAQPTR
jgi:hypothetical protein